jgi:hypothetical protein
MRSIDDMGFSGSGSKPRPVRAALPWRMPKPLFAVFHVGRVSSVEEQRRKPKVAGSSPVRAAIG